MLLCFVHVFSLILLGEPTGSTVASLIVVQPFP